MNPTPLPLTVHHTPQPSHAVVLFAHGSRDPLWRLPIEAVAARTRALAPDTTVTCAYLELCEPSLPDAVQALVDQGATHVRLLPVFFGMGKHAREDLPELTQALRAQHPGLTLTVLPAAGEHPALTSLLAQLALGVNTGQAA
jgi:sirohydrochlorin cobaltochelatase